MLVQIIHAKGDEFFLAKDITRITTVTEKIKQPELLSEKTESGFLYTVEVYTGGRNIILESPLYANKELAIEKRQSVAIKLAKNILEEDIIMIRIEL